MNQGKALQGRDSALELIAAYQAGQSMQEQADALELHPTALYRHILRHAPQEWAEVQGARALNRLELSDADLVTADDGVKVSRARERARLAMWTLERVARKLYGTDPVSVTVNMPGSPGEVVQAIRDLEQRLGLSHAGHMIEGTSETVMESSP